MNKRMLFVVAALCLGVTGHAETKKGESKEHKQSLHEQFSGAGYGLAGCGLGSIIFGAKPGKIQIISSTTNGLWGNQTFGITSGTSNCDIPRMGQQAALFIEVNKEIVKKDAARGEGETLASLAEILNCQDQALFARRMQENYGTIFAEGEDAYGNTRQILQTIKGNEDLALTCDIKG